VLDERLFSDTVIRVIQLKPSVFLVCDIRYLNGLNVFEKLSYQSRRTLLESLLHECHQPDLTALLTYEEMSEDASIRGYEHYDNEPGTMGVFLPVKE
jgi:ATP-dependent DNA ligase